MRNPFREIKERREEEKQRKKRQQKIALIVSCTGFASLMAFVFIMASLENDSRENGSLTSSTSRVVDGGSSSVAMSNVDGSMTDNIVQSVSTDEMELENKETSSGSGETADVPYNPVVSLNARYETDYAHFESDVVTLGNNESVTITITAVPAGLNSEDFTVHYDKEILAVECELLQNQEQLDNTVMVLKAKAKKPGSTQLVVCSTYSLIVLGGEAEGLVLPIIGLETDEGQVVYVTYQGEKYHKSASCVGETGIKTTKKDALACEYMPCNKCVN